MPQRFAPYVAPLIVLAVGFLSPGLPGTPGSAVAQTPPPSPSRTTVSTPVEVLPHPGSAPWFYERALVNFIFDRFKEADLDLTLAFEQKPQYPEAHYLLGVMKERQGRFGEAIECYKTVLLLTPAEHLPARLRLVHLLLTQERPGEAGPHVEKLIRLLKIPGTEIADARTQLQVLLATPDTRPSQIFALVDELSDRIDAYLADNPSHYLASTLDRGLNDGLVCLEYVNLVRKQAEVKPVEVNTALRKGFFTRSMFSPVLYFQWGEIEERQNHLKEAVAGYNQAIKQMFHLGFSEGNQDFSAEHFRELEQKLQEQSLKK